MVHASAGVKLKATLIQVYRQFSFPKQAIEVEQMVFRIFVLAVFCFAFGQSLTLAQTGVPQSQLDYVDAQLKQAAQELSQKVKAINYQDPGALKGWRVSQAAWEKMELRIGFPPPAIEEILETDAAKRTDEQKSAIKSFYLGCLLYTSPSPRDATLSRMPSSA